MSIRPRVSARLVSTFVLAIFLACLSSFALAQSSSVPNLTGEWRINANAHNSTLIVTEQSGARFSGRVFSEAMINGIIRGDTVTFTRMWSGHTFRQDYTGKLTIGADGKGTITGTFTQNSQGNYPWTATSTAPIRVGQPTHPPAPAGQAQIQGQVAYSKSKAQRARVIVGSGFNYRGPSERAVHQLEYRTKVADLRTDKTGRFTVNLPPGKYDILIWAECHVPQIYRAVTLTTTHTLNTQLGLGTAELGSHCPNLTLKQVGASSGSRTPSTGTAPPAADRCRPFGLATVVYCGRTALGPRSATVADCIRIFKEDGGWCCHDGTCTDPCAQTYPDPRAAPCNPRDFPTVPR